MDVRCEKCMTVYEFDDSKVGEQGVTVKCTQCGNLFKVKRRERTPGAGDGRGGGALAGVRAAGAFGAVDAADDGAGHSRHQQDGAGAAAAPSATAAATAPAPTRAEPGGWMIRVALGRDLSAFAS